MREITTDVLVVGGGLAALRSAYDALRAGARVTILSPRSGEIQGVRHDLEKTAVVKPDNIISDADAEASLRDVNAGSTVRTTLGSRGALPPTSCVAMPK